MKASVGLWFILGLVLVGLHVSCVDGRSLASCIEWRAGSRYSTTHDSDTTDTWSIAIEYVGCFNLDRLVAPGRVAVGPGTPPTATWPEQKWREIESFGDIPGAETNAQRYWDCAANCSSQLSAVDRMITQFALFDDGSDTGLCICGETNQNNIQLQGQNDSPGCCDAGAEKRSECMVPTHGRKSGDAEGKQFGQFAPVFYQRNTDCPVLPQKCRYHSGCITSHGCCVPSSMRFTLLEAQLLAWGLSLGFGGLIFGGVWYWIRWRERKKLREYDVGFHDTDVPPFMPDCRVVDDDLQSLEWLGIVSDDTQQCGRCSHPLSASLAARVKCGRVYHVQCLINYWLDSENGKFACPAHSHALRMCDGTEKKNGDGANTKDDEEAKKNASGYSVLETTSSSSTSSLHHRTEDDTSTTGPSPASARQHSYEMSLFNGESGAIGRDSVRGSSKDVPADI